MLIFLKKFLPVKYDSPVLFSSCSATFEKSFDDWAIFLSSLIHITFARTKTLALQALFVMHYFEMEVMVYNVHISQIMIYKALLWTDVFWISYIKWYIFYNNNLLFFFNITVKQSLLSLLQHNSKNKKFLSFFFSAFVFRMGSLPMCLQREHIG